MRRPALDSPKTFAVKVCDGAIWLVGMHVSGRAGRCFLFSSRSVTPCGSPTSTVVRPPGRRALLLDAWNGSAGVDAVVTAVVLAVSRA
jgi:hypothetical protein